MEDSSGEMLLPDLDLSTLETKKMQKALAKVAEKLPAEDDSGEDTDDGASDSESETTSDSDSDLEYECNVCDRKFSSYVSLKQHEKGRKHAKVILRKKKERKLLGKGEDDDTTNDDSLLQEPFAICKVCDKEFGGPESYGSHLKSKRHKNKALEASILKQVQDNGEIDVEKLTEICKTKQTPDYLLGDTKESVSLKLKADDEETHDKLECKSCDKVFSGLKPFTQHLLSKSHAKQMEKKKLLHKVIPEPSADDEISDNSDEHDLSTLKVEDDVLVCKLCSTSFSGPESAMMHLKSKKHSKNLDKHLRKLERKKEKKEAKRLTSDLVEKMKELQPKMELQDEAAEEQPQASSDQPDVSDKSGEDKAKPSTSGNNEFVARINYKKYKDLMHSLQKEDEVLQ